MTSMDRRQLLKGTAGVGGAAALIASGLLHPEAARVMAQRDMTGMVTVAEQQRETWIRNFNFLIPGNTALWPASFGVHEPLMLYNRANGELVPWLATAQEYSEDYLTLTFTIREGVQWSDGEAFDSSDVKYTFDLLMANDGLTGGGAIRNVLERVTSIEAPDPTSVVFTFSEVYSVGLYDIAAVNIVAEHVFSEVDDPVTFAYENPVGTGPFTEVPIFESQYYELRKNPNYWAPEKVNIEGLAFPVFNSNDNAQRAIVNGDVDWAGKFIPDVETTYVAQDPEHFGYWFPTTSDTVHLYLNTTVAPFDNVDVRKAISMALDRQDMVSFAFYDYNRPADSTGLSDAYPGWKDEQYANAEWVSYDPDRANELLDAAGLTLNGDVREFEGAPMEYQLLVVNGWTDWVQTCQIISDNLREVGIVATVTPLEQSTWQADRVGTGDFTMSLGWCTVGPSPFNFYRGIMSSQTLVPIGTNSGENWQRFASPEADALLDEFTASGDPDEQRRISSELQRVYSEQVPAIPLVLNLQWYEYNTRRFEGWPTEENPYAVPSTYANERLLVMTTITTRTDV